MKEERAGLPEPANGTASSEDCLSHGQSLVSVGVVGDESEAMLVKYISRSESPLLNPC